MKPTNSQFVPGRVASKTPFLFSAHDLAVVLVFMLSAVYLRAEEILLRQEHRKAKSWRDRWRLIIKAKNWKAVESRIADRFQSVHPDGPRDRAGEIALLKKMNFGDLR